MKTIKISPSILSVDFSRLGEQVREAESTENWVYFFLL